MKKYKFFTEKLLCIVLLTFHTIINAQNKILINDSIASKIIKNHFFPQYNSNFFFIQCGLQDKAGNMWFGSAGDGVYYYDGKSFTNYTTYDGLCHNDVLSILEDKVGNIWFGTRGGVCKLKLGAVKTIKGKISSFPLYSNTTGNSDCISSVYSGGFSSNFVWCMLQDKNGRLWFGTNDGVFLYDTTVSAQGNKSVITNFLDNAKIGNLNNLRLKTVQKIIEDKHGNIWFASGDFVGEGICFYDGKSVINFKPNNVVSFSSIIETKSGDLFFVSPLNGIFKMSGNIIPGERTKFVNYTDSIGLKKHSFTDILEDKNGNLWFTTDDEKTDNSGVWCYDGKSLRLFTTKDGLSNNSVHCILEDRKGNIWFGTRNTGLCCYNGKFFKNFTE